MNHRARAPGLQGILVSVSLSHPKSLQIANPNKKVKLIEFVMGEILL